MNGDWEVETALMHDGDIADRLNREWEIVGSHFDSHNGYWLVLFKRQVSDSRPVSMA